MLTEIRTRGHELRRQAELVTEKVYKKGIKIPKTQKMVPAYRKLAIIPPYSNNRRAGIFELISNISGAAHEHNVPGFSKNMLSQQNRRSLPPVSVHHPQRFELQVRAEKTQSWHPSRNRAVVRHRGVSARARSVSRAIKGASEHGPRPTDTFTLTISCGCQRSSALRYKTGKP